MSDDDNEIAIYVDPARPQNVARTVAVNGEIIGVLAAMSAPAPIGFSDCQLATIFRLARGMKRTTRERYLDGIASRLPAEPTDSDIWLAIELAAGGGE